MYDKDYVPYTAKRWTEIPAYKVIGSEEIPPEKAKAAREELEKLIARAEDIRAKKKAGIPVDDRL